MHPLIFKAYFKALSPIRLWNYFMVEASYRISAIMKKPWHWGMPYSISVEPTTSCNLKCPQCPSGLRKFTRATGNIDIQTLKVLLDQSAKTLMYITFYFQGEPFIHKDFLEMVRMAKKKRIFVATSSNAHFIDKEKAKEIVQSGLDKLIISMDGTDQSTYEKYRRGGNLETVISSIKHLVEAKKIANSQFPVLELQFLVLRHNEHQMEKVKELGKEWGVDYVQFKSAQVYEYEEGEDFIPENLQHTRYEKMPDGKYRIKSSLPNRCPRMWRSSVMTWDGNIVPCCFDKDATQQMGNILEIPLNKIWKSQDYKKFRHQILNDRKQIEICRNCTEGLKE